MLLAGVDENGPQLYQVDPSGSYFAWKASAIGKNAINARTFLEKRYSEDIELEDAIHTALLTLKDGFEGGFKLRPWPRLEAGRGLASSIGWRCSAWYNLRPQYKFMGAGRPYTTLSAPKPMPTLARLPSAGELTGETVEVGIVGEDRVFRVLTAAEVSDYLQEVE